jgi:hypothetical protein
MLLPTDGHPCNVIFPYFMKRMLSEVYPRDVFVSPDETGFAGPYLCVWERSALLAGISEACSAILHSVLNVPVGDDDLQSRDRPAIPPHHLIAHGCDQGLVSISDVETAVFGCIRNVHYGVIKRLLRTETSCVADFDTQGTPGQMRTVAPIAKTGSEVAFALRLAFSTELHDVDLAASAFEAAAWNAR